MKEKAKILCKTTSNKGRKNISKRGGRVMKTVQEKKIILLAIIARVMKTYAKLFKLCRLC